MKRGIQILTLIFFVFLGKDSLATLDFRTMNNDYSYCTGETTSLIWNTINLATTYKIYCPGISGVFITTSSNVSQTPLLTTILGNGLWTLEAISIDGSVLETENLNINVATIPTPPITYTNGSIITNVVGGEIFVPLVGSDIHLSTPVIDGEVYTWRSYWSGIVTSNSLDILNIQPIPIGTICNGGGVTLNIKNSLGCNSTITIALVCSN